MALSKKAPKVNDTPPAKRPTSDAMAKLKARQSKNTTSIDAHARPTFKHAHKGPESVDEIAAKAGAEASRDEAELDGGPVKKYNGHRENKRPATRTEIKQAAKTRRREEDRRKTEDGNRIRVQQGKDMKGIKGLDHKPSIWEKIAEPKLYDLLGEMGDTKKAIDKFQRKRIMLAGVILVIGLIAGFMFHPWLYLLGPIGGFIMYKMQLKNVESFYRGWKFQRQLNFSKFTRLVIPYLKASGGGAALYTIFNKILKRTDDESDRRNLYQLMGEMGDRPQDIQPFLDYAERSSGTDMSHLFMSTIFDFQQSTFDVTVIDELGKMASEDMMNAVDEIINMKLKRFNMFPTKVVMSSFILIAGLAIGIMLYNFQDLGFGGDMGSFEAPESAAGAAEDVDSGASEPDGDTVPVEDSGAIDEDVSPATPMDGLLAEDLTNHEPQQNSDGMYIITNVDGSEVVLEDGRSYDASVSCESGSLDVMDYNNPAYGLDLDLDKDGLACE